MTDVVQRLAALAHHPRYAEICAVLAPKPPDHLRDLTDAELEHLSPAERAELVSLLDAKEEAAPQWWDDRPPF